MTKQKSAVVMAFLAMILFVISQITMTFCFVSLNLGVADNEVAPNFIVNFNDGANVSGITMQYYALSQNETSSSRLLTKEAKEHIEKIAKDEFNAKYNIALVVHYSLYTNDGTTRMTDFSKMSSIETLVSIQGGQPNTSKDAYCAVFVPLDSQKEKQVLESHDYSVFENVKDIAKVETIEATSSEDSKLTLKANAQTDGFLFVLTFGENKSNIGMIVMIVSIVVSIVFLVLLILSIRSYLIQRRRKKFSQEVKSMSSLAGKSVLEQFESKQPKKAPKKASVTALKNEEGKMVPKMPVKPKAPSLKNQSNAQTKKEENPKEDDSNTWFFKLIFK